MYKFEFKLTNPVASFGVSKTVTKLIGSTAWKFCGDIITDVCLRIVRHCVPRGRNTSHISVGYSEVGGTHRLQHLCCVVTALLQSIDKQTHYFKHLHQHFHTAPKIEDLACMCKCRR